VSDWNHAGTWEERDITARAREELQGFLSTLKLSDAEDGWGICVRSAEVTEGEAQVILTRGKKKVHFEFKCKLKLEFVKEPQETTIKIDLIFADMSPDSAFEYAIKSRKGVEISKQVYQALEKFRDFTAGRVKSDFMLQLQ
jgi:activator of HSP90 ATPase